MSKLKIVDTSKKIYYQCQCTPACTGVLELYPHHSKPAGLLVISGAGRDARSVQLPAAAFLALWESMSAYQVDRRCTEEEGEDTEC
jgi:hypothetical protein